MKLQRPTEKAELSAQIEKDIAAYCKAGGKKPVCAPNKSYTVAEIKEKRLVNVGKILTREDRKRPSV